jgi:putative transposase
MKKPRYTDQQIAQTLRQAEQGLAVAELCRKLGVSETTFCHWKKRYAGMGVAELRWVSSSRGRTGGLSRWSPISPWIRRCSRTCCKKGLRPPGAARWPGIWSRHFGCRRGGPGAVARCNRATFYCRSRRHDVTQLRMRLRQLAAARPQFGYRRLHIALAGRAGGAITRRRIGCIE